RSAAPAATSAPSPARPSRHERPARPPESHSSVQSTSPTRAANAESGPATAATTCLRGAHQADRHRGSSAADQPLPPPRAPRRRSGSTRVSQRLTRTRRRILRELQELLDRRIHLKIELVVVRVEHLLGETVEVALRQHALPRRPPHRRRDDLNLLTAQLHGDVLVLG